MPPNIPPAPIIDEAAEKKRLAEEKKSLKKDKKSQMKEVKSRAKEIERQERSLEGDAEPKGGSVFVVTLVIILIWLVILALLVKLDVGGFGSGVLTPLLKDIPVVNLILPSGTAPGSRDEPESYMGYDSIREAVDYIRVLELEVEKEQLRSAALAEENEELRAQVARLKEFEDRQVEFQRIKNEFYEEVVYAEAGPGPEEYRRYYEMIDPATAEMIYRQVVTESEASQEVQDYARAYAEMRPQAAAAIFEEMTTNLELAARILSAMNAESRGAVLAAMDPEIAAQLTRLMEPRP